MTAISYHETINDLQGLDWFDGGPFARLQWFGLLERYGKRPVLATACNGLDAVSLPLQKCGGGFQALTNWYAFTWSDLHTGALPSDQLLAELTRDLARKIDKIVLDKLPIEDGTAQRLGNAFRNSGWLVLEEPCDTNHILKVTGRSFAEYLASRPGRLRTTLKRKAKKVDISLTRQFSADDWAAYEAIYAESWKPEEGDPALLRSFAMEECAAGRFLFGIARHEGEPVAAQFWTVDQGTAYIHKLAHRESAKPLSPGTSLTAALFEQVIDLDKVDLVDFGTGDDPYKRDWMEEVRTRHRLTCLRVGSPSNWPLLAKAGLRKLVSGKRGS